MALLHTREQEMATTVEDRQQALAQTREALTKALELDPNLAVAHSRMAGVYRDSWEFAAAERSTERALAAGPKDPLVLGNAALLYDCLGRLDKAISLGERRRVMDPLAGAGTTNLAFFYTQAGRLDEAEVLCRGALELRPDNALVYGLLAPVHLIRGRPEEAKASYARYVELSGEGDHGRLWTDAVVEHTAGNQEASRKAVEEFESRFGREDPATCAEIRAWRGEADAAFAWLDKALAARDPYLAQLKTDIYVTSLHSDPRWDALLRKIGLPTD
jgi:Tfp pilus assembly protein PilF